MLHLIWLRIFVGKENLQSENENNVLILNKDLIPIFLDLKKKSLMMDT